VRIRAALAAAVMAAATFGVTLAVAPPASANGPCLYVTGNDNAYVRENPSGNSVVRKTVPPHYRMTGPTFCGYQGGWDGHLWVAVDCTCATDNVGWVIASKVSYLGT
jgi:hypothetical protein